LHTRNGVKNIMSDFGLAPTAARCAAVRVMDQ
jgi:hypothetical protein